jgi:hypothetical protein
MNHFNRTIVTNLYPDVKQVDSDDAVTLFSYNECKVSTSKIVQLHRGTVFEGEKLVCRALPFAPEYTINDKENVSINLQHKMFLMNEGATLRLFFANNRWYLSTHRKLDAFKSKWGSSCTFGELFLQALEHQISLEGEKRSLFNRFTDTLNTNYQYYFLLQNNKNNRIVITAPENPRLFHMGTFVSFETFDTDTIDIGLPKCTLCNVNFENQEQVFSYVENEIDPFQYQGILILNPQDCSQIKIMNSKYAYYASLRGNSPNILYRYIEIRTNSTQKEDFFMLYPEYADRFATIEAELRTVANLIHKAYINRFVKKLFSPVPQEEYRVIKECHDWHLQNQDCNKVCYHTVLQSLNRQTPGLLFRIIRRRLNY